MSKAIAFAIFAASIGERQFHLSDEDKLIENQQLEQAYIDVFSSKNGQRVLIDIVNSNGVLANTYQNEESSEIRAYREGMRQAAINILNAALFPPVLKAAGLIEDENQE